MGFIGLLLTRILVTQPARNKIVYTIINKANQYRVVRMSYHE
jgi:hypothetical protein